MDKAIYITRSDIGWYSKNANAYRKPLEVATKYETTLVVPEYCRVPQEIAEKCVEIAGFDRLKDLSADADFVFTGFDFPCMCKAWRLKKRLGCQWTIFLWDPPCLSYRDGFPPLRWAIDALFRFFAKRCDRLVLNIHPGLLTEILGQTFCLNETLGQTFRLTRNVQVELRMQDAFEGIDFNHVEHVGHVDGFEYDFGVLSNWSKAKGGLLMAEAIKRLPGKKCLWIGDPPKGQGCDQIEFAGRLPQAEAFEMLLKCRVLVVPYLPTRALKWNYPLKLYEYLQIGRPIVSSDNPGNAAIAARYPGRITLFKSGDVDDLVEKLSLA